MADVTEVENEDLEVLEEQGSKDKQKTEQNKALDKMTDVVEEKQLDEGRVKQAMETLAAAQKADKEAAKQRERELAAVKVSQEDVEVVAREFELDKKAAERKLRENKGDLLATLTACLA